MVSVSNIKNIKRHKLIDGITIHSDDFIHVDRLVDHNTMMSEIGKIPLRYPLKTAAVDEMYFTFEDYYINYRKYMKSRSSLKPIDRSEFSLVENIVRITLEDWSVR